MRARLEGNHSAGHCGSSAVWVSMHTIARSNGWTIVDPNQDYDALILNGEGSMHHSRKSWHNKMIMLRDALDAGKRAYLVNSVWQDNGPEYDDVLRSLSGIWVREVHSQRDLRERHGIEAKVAPDLSIFHRGSPSIGARLFHKRKARTDFWSHEFSGFVSPTAKSLTNVPMLSMAGRWSDFVYKVSKLTFLLTGRHHAVYAACQARTPFFALEGNTHKISGIIASAGARIPLFQSAAEITTCDFRTWREHEVEYRKLYDWMAAQRPENAFPAASQPRADDKLPVVVGQYIKRACI